MSFIVEVISLALTTDKIFGNCLQLEETLAARGIAHGSCGIEVMLRIPVLATLACCVQQAITVYSVHELPAMDIYETLNLKCFLRRELIVA